MNLIRRRSPYAALLLLTLFVTSLAACTANDPLIDDLFTKNVYPGTTNTYRVGSPALQYLSGYFQNVYINGIGVIAANVTSTANLDDNTVIRGDGGILGVQDSLVTISDFGVIYTPGDINTDSDVNAGNDVNVTNDLDVTDDATIGGTLNMTSGQINNLADPTLPQDAATKNYVDTSISGNFTKWDDIRTPVNALKVPTINPPSWANYKSTQVLAFSDQAVEGNEEIVYLSVQLPHSYKEGTDIEPHIHWLPEDGTGGNVQWLFTYSWANIDGAFPDATSSNVTAATGAADTHLTADFPNIDGAGKTISSMLLGSLKRNSSNALDTYNGKDAYLLEIDFHYQTDAMGSSTETTK